MKSLLLLLALSAAAPACRAQQAMVMAARMNIAYTGISNPLTAMAIHYPCSSLLLTTDNGQIKKGTGCDFELTPAHTGIALIRIAHEADGKAVLLEEVRLRVHSIPPPVPMLAGKRSGRIAAVVLRAQLGLAAYLDGFDYDAHIVVKSFQLTLLRPDGSGHTLYTNQGPYFTPDMKTLLQEAQAGDQLLFFRITADGPAEKGVSLVPAEFTVD